MVITANALRTQLVALTNFSGTHKEHADKYVFTICLFIIPGRICCIHVNFALDIVSYWRVFYRTMRPN